MSRILAIAMGLVAGAAGPAADALAASLSDEEARVLVDEVRALRSKVEVLEKRLTEDEAERKASTTIKWKGSPQFVQQDRTFKVKGRIQTDAGHVAAPGGLDDKGLGFSNEFRRIRLGGEGRLGSGFGYKLELELSDNAVDLVDAFVTHDSGLWRLTIGNHNQFQSLDELTGDTSGSFMERAAFTDAFNFERRLGVSAQYARGLLLLQAGVFTDDIGALANDSDGPSGGDENNSFSIDGRVVYSPEAGNAQLHLGSSAHWRKLERISDDPVRYRQRPFLHATNSRLIGTRPLNVEREFSYGVELAAVKGPWSAAAETHWLRATRMDGPAARFFGGYAELGYFLTRGDRRPYKNGIFGVTDPKRPLGDGGVGAVQVNLRYDYLDLDSREIRGGKQNAYLASVIWSPVNYLRLNLNYGYIDYDGAIALADGRADYGVHVVGSRLELDF